MGRNPPVPGGTTRCGMLQCFAICYSDTIKVQHATWLRLPLQHPAIPFTSLQRTAPLCTHLGPIKLLGFVSRHNALQHSKTRCMTATHFNTLHALELQTATRLHPPSQNQQKNTLQHSKITCTTTAHYISLHPTELHQATRFHLQAQQNTKPCNILKHPATHCNTQHTPQFHQGTRFRPSLQHSTPPCTTPHTTLNHTAQTSGSSIHCVSSPVAAPIRTPRKFSSSLDLPFFGLNEDRFFFKW